jgi:3-hydroxyisobutyrate dehydrogenase
VLESISPNTVYCGETGNGHVAKLIQNAVASCNRLLTYEAASIAVKYGLKLADVSAVINQSTGWSGATERILPTLSEGKATADFQLQLMVKDLKLAARMGMDGGAPMLVSNTVCSLFEMGVHTQGPTANLDAMARLFETMGNVKFSGA